MKIRENDMQSSARLTQNVNIVSKNVQILLASLAFTYIVFCAKGVYINVHFVMMKCHFEQCKQRRCLKCQKVFNTQQELKVHGVKKHPKYSCTRCKAFL